MLKLTLLGWKRAFDFSGRSTRAEYWEFFASFVVLMILAMVADEQLLRAGEEGGPLAAILVLVVLIPVTAVGVRRLHDTDRLGFWLLLFGLGLIGWGFLFYFLVSPGTPGENRYGFEDGVHDLADIFS
jgi:uncharacterized membrane protein YhaH (DUF805 family)